MNSRFSLLALAVLTVFSLGCETTQNRERDEWTVLFDGSGLTHWDVIAGGEWTIEYGALVGRNGQDWTTDPELTGSYLRSKEMYGDFELSLEYAINPRGNSGVFIRSAKEKNPAYTGYEMQITDAHGRELNKYNSGIYDVVGLSKNVIKPAGQWNHAVIRAEGPRIRITVNGEAVVDYTGDRRLAGHIGLQNHDENSVVKFRNIKIREL